MNPFLSGIPQLGGDLMRFFTLCALCSERVLVLMIIFPPTNDKVLHGRVRTGIATLWGTYVALGQQATLPQLQGWMLVLLVGKEAIVGLVIALVASPLFWVAEAAGAYIDDLTGYNNIQMINPSQGEHTSLTSTLMSQCATVAFWTLGGMTFLLGALFESYRFWPLASITPVPAVLLQWFATTQTDSLMEMTAKLATPAMLLLLLVDFGIGLITRVAQRLDLASLAQPIKGALGVLMLALLAGIFVNQVRDQVSLMHIADQVRAVAQHH